MTHPARTFCQISEDGYQLTIAALGIQLTVDRLRRERKELVGELAVACDLAGAKVIDGFLSIADFNLSSAIARSTRAKLLAERSEAVDLDWLSFLEELCVRTIKAEREGTPAKPLHLFTGSDETTLFDVNGWRLLRHQPSILFGDGGALKSYIALYTAGLLSQQGIRVAYCDWELTAYEHRARLERLFAELPTVYYLRCDRPLTDERDRISREVRRLGLEYTIFDSAGFATAGPPEAAEHALSYFRADRQIGIGSLSLAHMNRSESGDQKPFGSAFWHNSARATWFAKTATAPGDEGRMTVGLFNRKSNLTRLFPPVGYDFHFASDRIGIERVNLEDNPQLAPEVPLWIRMRTALDRGAMTPAALANELGTKVEHIERTVRRKDGVFLRFPGPDGVTRIGLIQRGGQLSGPG